MTIRKARLCSTIPSASPRHRVAEDDDPARDRRDVRRGARERDDRDGLGLLEPAGGRVERDDRGDDRDASQGEARIPPAPPAPVSALIAMSETPNMIPAAAPRKTPWCSCARTLGDQTMKPPTASRPASKLIIAGVRVARVRAVGPRKGDRQQREPEGRHAHADPLPRADVEAEDAIREDREEDEAARDDRLDERQGSERHGRHVEDPGADGDAHADRKPLRVQRLFALRSGCLLSTSGAAQAPLCLNRKPKFGEGAGEREQQSELYGSSKRV